MDLSSIIIGVIAVICGFRVFLTQSRARKLLYLCCLNFCIAALIALYIKSPMGGLASIVYLISSTLSSNAIAYTLEQMKKVE
jgi:energy-converting hydrogenase A subunit C